MAGSVGGSAAQGLEAGFNIGFKADEAKRRKEQDDITNTRNAALDDERRADRLRVNARQDKADAEHDDDRALGALDKELEGHRFQLGSLHARYGDGGKIPDSEAKPLYTAVGETSKKRQALLSKRYQPVVEQTVQKWRDFASKAEAGQTDPSTLRGADLKDFIKATTGHDLQDYVNGTIGTSIEDAEAGMSSGNMSLAVRAAGTLLGPQIRKNLGGTARDGSQIVDKELFALLPAPRQPGMQPSPMQTNPVQGLMASLNAVMAPPEQAQQTQQTQQPQQPGMERGEDMNLLLPVLNVTTRRPDGTLSSYHAPVTKGRGTDDSEEVSGPLKMSDLVDRMGRLGVVNNWLKTPEMKKAVEEALAEGPTSFEQAWGMVHGDPKLLKDVADDPTSKKIAAGRKLAKELGIDFAEAMRQIEGRSLPKETGVAAKLTAIKNSNLPEADKTKAERVALGVEKVATPKAGSSGAGAGVSTGKSTKLGGLDAPAGVGDEAVDFWAKAVLAGDRDWQVGLGRSKSGSELIEKVKRRVPQLAKELGLEPQDMGTTRAENAALGATLKDLTKRAEAVELFSSKVSKDMKTFDDLLDKASTGSPLLISKPINALRRQFSDSDLAQLDLAAKQVGAEYERLITGGTLSVAQLHAGASEDAKKLINGDMPPKQARAVMEVMQREMQNAKTAAHESQKRITDQMRNLGRGRGTGLGEAGKPAGTAFTDEAAAAAAAKAGTLKAGDRITINGQTGTWK